MKAFLEFWKKDIINKLIVLVALSLVVGAGVIAYLLANMTSDSMFYAVFEPVIGKGALPTLAVAPTKPATEPPFTFPTDTALPPTATVELAATNTVAATEAAPIAPTATIPQPTETLAPLVPTPTGTALPATPVATRSAQDVMSCIPANPPQTGKVLDVIDGNTVKVLIEGVAYTVRYIGIDVPRYKPSPQYFGQEADFKNAEYVFAEQVTLISDIQDKDESGRLLRYVKVGDIFVNYELVKQGYATASATASSCSELFKQAEQFATQNQAGLWKPTPTVTVP